MSAPVSIAGQPGSLPGFEEAVRAALVAAADAIGCEVCRICLAGVGARLVAEAPRPAAADRAAVIERRIRERTARAYENGYAEGLPAARHRHLAAVPGGS